MTENQTHKLLLYIKTLFVISSTNSSLLYTYQAMSFYYNSTIYQLIMETRNNKNKKSQIWEKQKYFKIN